jgi:hypothetical protein
MGMFDYVYSEYPLPGEPLEFVDEFQTKDLDCTLAELTITEEGKLVGRQTLHSPFAEPDEPDASAVLVDYTGILEFYGSNIVGGSGAGHYTKNGEDAEMVTYEAIFVEGKLIEIKQVSYKKSPAVAISEMRKFHSSGPGSQLDEDAEFEGLKLFVCWGGVKPEDGYYAEVVAETERELCLKHEGRLETIDRGSIGRILFKDMEEAKADREHTQKQKEAEKENYRKIVEGKK